MDKMRFKATALVIDGTVEQAKYISAILNSSLGHWFTRCGGKS